MNESEVKRLINVYTGGYPKQMFWILTGRSKVTARQHIMSEILGRKATQKESGINALCDSLFDYYHITEGCLAEMEDKLFEAMRF